MSVRIENSGTRKAYRQATALSTKIFHLYQTGQKIRIGDYPTGGSFSDSVNRFLYERQAAKLMRVRVRMQEAQTRLVSLEDIVLTGLADAARVSARDTSYWHNASYDTELTHMFHQCKSLFGEAITLRLV